MYGDNKLVSLTKTLLLLLREYIHPFKLAEYIKNQQKLNVVKNGKGECVNCNTRG